MAVSVVFFCVLLVLAEPRVTPIPPLPISPDFFFCWKCSLELLSTALSMRMSFRASRRVRSVETIVLPVSWMSWPARTSVALPLSVLPCAVVWPLAL
ncbi:hypothetical protein D9M68_741690 [compost metagenome]